MTFTTSEGEVAGPPSMHVVEEVVCGYPMHVCVCVSVCV